MLPILEPKAPAAAIALDETRPVWSGSLPSAAILPNGRTGTTPRQEVEVEAAAMFRYRQRVWVSEQRDARLPRCSRRRQRLRISEQRGVRALLWTPFEDPLRGEPSRTAMMLPPERVEEVGAAAMLSMPATVAGIGTAGREGIAMDPL